MTSKVGRSGDTLENIRYAHEELSSLNERLSVSSTATLESLILTGSLSVSGSVVAGSGHFGSASISGTMVASLANLGSASVSGTVVTQSLLTGNLSVSGTVVTQLLLAGGVSVSGTVVTSLLSTGQVQFPATQNASSDPNTLDDYEESNWTPVFSFTTPGDISVSSSFIATYVKIGKMVCLNGVFEGTPVYTTSTGGAVFTGLPFNVGTNGNGHGTMEWQGISVSSYTQIVLRATAVANIIEFRASGQGLSVTSLQTTSFPSASRFAVRFSLVYFA